MKIVIPRMILMTSAVVFTAVSLITFIPYSSSAYAANMQELQPHLSERLIVTGFTGTFKKSSAYVVCTPVSDSRLRATVTICGIPYHSEYVQCSRGIEAHFDVSYPSWDAGMNVSYHIESENGDISEEKSERIVSDSKTSTDSEISIHNDNNADNYTNADITPHIPVTVKSASFHNTAAIITTAEQYFYRSGIGLIRAVVQIGGIRYYSDYSSRYLTDTYEIAYPAQSAGTAVRYWFEGEFSGKTDEAEGITVPDVVLNTESASAKFFPKKAVITFKDVPVAGTDREGIKFRVAATIGGQQYLTDYADGASDELKITISYPEQEEGTAVTYRFETDTGLVSPEIKTEIKNKLPVITDYTLNSGSSRFTGKTSADSDITVEYNGKTLNGSSDAKGKFNINVGRLKAGAKVCMTITDPYGSSGSATFKVEQARGSIKLTNVIYRNTTTLKFKATNVAQGDYVVAAVGGRKYRYSFKKNEKGTVQASVKIRKTGYGKKINLVYYDKFGKIKGKKSGKVYYDSVADIGMTKAQVSACYYYGDPDEVTTSTNGYSLWVYYDDDEHTGADYVYFRNGIVTEISSVSI